MILFVVLLLIFTKIPNCIKNLEEKSDTRNPLALRLLRLTHNTLEIL